MCWCRPNLRTPFCGRSECQRPVPQPSPTKWGRTDFKAFPPTLHDGWLGAVEKQSLPEGFPCGWDERDAKV